MIGLDSLSFIFAIASGVNDIVADTIRTNAGSPLKRLKQAAGSLSRFLRSMSCLSVGEIRIFINLYIGISSTCGAVHDSRLAQRALCNLFTIARKFSGGFIPPLFLEILEGESAPKGVNDFDIGHNSVDGSKKYIFPWKTAACLNYA
jgi:hypothetical protein